MVAAGIQPDVIDRMDIGDIVSWYEVMVEYHREIDKITPKGESR